MNWFDLVMLFLLLIALVNGYRKGLVQQLVGLAIILLSAVFGGKLAAYIFPELDRFLELSPDLARVLSFILAFAAIAIVISLIGKLIQQLLSVILLSTVNRILGSIIAVGTLMFILSIILNLVLVLDKNETVISEETKKDSFFLERVEAVVPAVVPYLNKELWELIPKNYREEIENKSDSIFQNTPKGKDIDSVFQREHFTV
ncbi:MAG TPA: CvpA family protein [Bacteroidales bacterium]|nr:CvpA family protein [Bacteroidales bacterium]